MKYDQEECYFCLRQQMPLHGSFKWLSHKFKMFVCKIFASEVQHFSVIIGQPQHNLLGWLIGSQMLLRFKFFDFLFSGYSLPVEEEDNDSRRSYRRKKKVNKGRWTKEEVSKFSCPSYIWRYYTVNCHNLRYNFPVFTCMWTELKLRVN